MPSPTIIPEGSPAVPPYPAFSEAVTAAGGAPAAFTGRYEDILLRPGLTMMIRDLKVLHDMEGHKEAGPAIQVGMMLEGAGTSRLSGHAGATAFPTNRMSVIQIDRPATSSFFVPAGTTLRYIDLRFERFFLRSLLKDSPLLAETDLADATMRDHGVSFALLPLDAAARRLAADILARPGVTPGDRLYLESKAIEALSHALTTLAIQRTQGGKGEGRAVVPLSARDRQRIRDAHDLLVADIEHTPLLRDLARRVGLNDNKLKNGFRQIYGNSVYAYLQERRMAVAASLLRAGSHSVTEVSLAVGYANPAHFSKLFRRYHGMPPSALLRGQAPEVDIHSQ